MHSRPRTNPVLVFLLLTVVVFSAISADVSHARATGAAGIQSIAPACADATSDRYDDVSGTHAAAIDCVGWWGIAHGVGDGRYNPAGDVRRDQLASFIARAITKGAGKLPPEPPSVFDDVAGNVHELAIEQLAAAQIVGGVGDSRYAPRQSVTRGQMASFLARSWEEFSGEPMPVGREYFVDVSGTTHEDNINRIASAGITAGTTSRRYEPAMSVSRAQMATFISRLLAALIDEGHIDYPPQNPQEPDVGVAWEGGFDDGGMPAGSITGGGSDDSQYRAILQRGGAGESELVSDLVRTAGSERSLKLTMGTDSVREQWVGDHAWTPDGVGSVEEWYGFSLYYDHDWDLDQISGTYWHNPVAWRMDGDNGSLNFSGDRVDGEPRMMLRRNTVKNNQGFYTDGLGLDKIDAGPIVVGEWMDFVVRIRWSTTSENALREVWRDGQYMGGKTSLNAVDSERHRFRIGQYQTSKIDHARTTYVDNVRIGDSYAAVDPS